MDVPPFWFLTWTIYVLTLLYRELWLHVMADARCTCWLLHLARKRVVENKGLVAKLPYFEINTILIVCISVIDKPIRILEVLYQQLLITCLFLPTSGNVAYSLSKFCTVIIKLPWSFLLCSWKFIWSIRSFGKWINERLPQTVKTSYKWWR